jgi:D-3-phosphoglycerate dehydrogenase / 2-oxoglutarate reductase
MTVNTNAERRIEASNGQSGNAAPRILVCDPIADDGVEALQRAGADVEVKTGLPADELLQLVDGFDALVVRSETKVTREIIEASSTLQVVGRAGIGVDNIDLEAATEKGIVVVNAPTGNVISAAEHAIALMLSLSRHIPAANASLKSGKWERGKFQGIEVRGKTLGIIGLGQVGSEVARRARGLEMRVLAHDPFVPEERARVIGAEVVKMDDLVRESDFITVHTTLSESTKSLIGEDELRSMKPSVRVINTARGGIIDEQALKKALDEGWIAGAAVDVFEKEPVTEHPLFESEKAVVTPHLGASTAEAQERVAVDVAEQIMAVLSGQPARYAVNAPLIPAETYSFLAPYLKVAFKAGELAVQLHEGQMGRIEIDYSGEIAQHDVTPLKAAVVGGILAPISEDHVNVVNVDIISQRRGLDITEKRGPSHEIYANLIRVRIGGKASGSEISATLAHDGPHIVSIDGFWVDVPPSEGYLLLVENKDRPGMVGAVGTLTGQFGVNINFMNVGKHEKRGGALMVLTLDEMLTAEQLARVKEIPDILSVQLARL